MLQFACKGQNINLIMSGGWDCEQNGINFEIGFSFDIQQNYEFTVFK